MMSKKLLFPILGLVCLAGMLIGIGLLERPVSLVVNGDERTVITRALTVRGVLRAAGVDVRQGDVIEPSLASFAPAEGSIRLAHARPALVFVAPGGEAYRFSTVQYTPETILAEGGINLTGAERIYFNGEELEPNAELPIKGPVVLELRQPVDATLSTGDSQRTITSAERTLGGALWAAGVRLNGADVVSEPLDSTLHAGMQASLLRSVPVTISAGKQKFTSRTTAATVGEALAEAGFAPVGMDYSLPAEDQPIPSDGAIRLVRVQEVVELVQTPIPYKTEYVSDPNTELGVRSVVTAGKYGLKVSRVRVRYEDGKEVSRAAEDSWVVRDPENEKAGCGTKVVYKTIDTPSGPLQYYRALTVHATSYSPCRSGDPTGKCWNGTVSGMPVKRGTIAVTREWYYIYAGKQLYVPGYGVGTIGDIGGGIPGVNWIDLAFTDEDYENWYFDITVYFLGTPPDNVTCNMP